MREKGFQSCDGWVMMPLKLGSTRQSACSWGGRRGWRRSAAGGAVGVLSHFLGGGKLLTWGTYLEELLAGEDGM